MIPMNHQSEKSRAIKLIGASDLLVSHYRVLPSSFKFMGVNGPGPSCLGRVWSLVIMLNLAGAG